MKRSLKRYPEFDIVWEASHVDEAKTLIDTVKLDILFLDIHMPGKSGFDLFRRFQKKYPHADEQIALSYKGIILDDLGIGIKNKLSA